MFLGGILDSKKEERGGRPKSNRTEVNIVAVADLVKKKTIGSRQQ